MARIRSAKPEFWTKQKLVRDLPDRDLRFTFKGIWEVCCDDDGRFDADPRGIKSELWRYDDDITVRKIEKWLKVIAGSGRIVLYEVDGIRYGYVRNFLKHQKISHPTPSKLPPPPPELLRNDSGATPEPLRPDLDRRGEDGIRRGGGARARARAAAAAELPRVVEALPADGEFDPLADLLVSAPSPRSWLRAIDEVLFPDPEAGAAPLRTPAEVRQALTDWVANGARPNLRLFRGYLRGSRAPPGTQPGAYDRRSSAAPRGSATEVFSRLEGVLGD